MTNSTSVSVNGYGSLASYTYNSYNGKLNTVTYGNGFAEKYVYDELDRISEIKYNTGSSGAYVTAYRYTYSTAGQLIAIEDKTLGKLTRYHYDAAGKLLGSTVSSTSTQKNETDVMYAYDGNQRVVRNEIYFSCSASDGASRDRVGHTYTYDSLGRISGASLVGATLSGSIRPVYDSLNRLTSRTVSLSASVAFYQQASYSYVTGSNGQTGLVSQLQNKIGTSASNAVVTNTWNYTYDANGNITQITNAGGTVQYKYTYDALGQLIREDNAVLGHTYVYTYDAAGNITSVNQYAFTTGALGTVLSTDSYTYGNSYWKDLLTKYNDQTIEYDEIGNPTKIGTYNAAGYWENYQGYNWQGRQLMSISMGSGSADGTTSEHDIYWFSYNEEGLRVRKSVNGYADITYLYNGSQLIGEKINNDVLLLYIYDEAGSIIGLKYREAIYSGDLYDCYYFEKNLQGDITAIYNEVGEKIGSYTYDAWGKPTVVLESTATTIERQIVQTYNPFRYRGYYYDTETGLYYLQSRYYNPEWGRFLNADSALYHHLIGYNMFAYCYNNPVTYIDPAGENPEAVAAGGWAASMWWLTIADGPLPIGEIVYVVGIVAIGFLATSKAPTISWYGTDSLDNDNVLDREKTKVGEKHGLPAEGDPDSDQELYDEEGLKQKRHYGPDGKAEYDIDYRHPDPRGTHEFPHRHNFDWNNKPPRSEWISIFKDIKP